MSEKPYYVMHGKATLHGPMGYDAAEHWYQVESDRLMGVEFVDEHERNIILAGDRLPQEKVEMFDGLRQLIGDRQAVIWWQPEHRSFAVYPLQPDERIMREPSALARQVMALEEKAGE